jgi:hypothetical protein
LTQVKGSGENGRIVKRYQTSLHGFTCSTASATAPTAKPEIAPAQKYLFLPAKFSLKKSRIRKCENHR